MPDTSSVSRRSFIKSTAMAGTFFGFAGCGFQKRNSSIRVAVVGLHRRGNTIIQNLFTYNTPETPELDMPEVELVAVCDVDSAILAERAAGIQADHGVTVKTYGDFRDLLADKDVDAVVITTPNHWHALQTIWACEAGKDVYVEKPVCHSVWEGRQMVEAARQHKRIVQSGFQTRSDTGLMEAVPYIQSGELGAITHIRGLCYRNRDSIGVRKTPLTPPTSIDYDQWLGPADDLPILREQFHYDWHWVWNTGNGDIGNQGPHQLDQIRWFLGGPTHPRSVYSFGGRFGWDDAGETPNMQFAGFMFGDTPVHFEVRDLKLSPERNSSPNYNGIRVGVIVSCEGGEFRGGNAGGMIYDNDGKRIVEFKGEGGWDHFPGFLRAVRDRNEDELACNIEQGYHSSALAHLANASYQLGNTVDSASLKSVTQSNEQLTDVYERYVKQLADWNLKESDLHWTLGPQLAFDAAGEQFTGPNAKQANQLLKREGRGPYKIPQYI